MTSETAIHAAEEVRPEPGPPLDIEQPREILRHLLVENLRRLSVAVEIERAKAIIFPETSVILKDVHRLLLAYHDKRRVPAAGLDPEGLVEGQDADLGPAGDPANWARECDEWAARNMVMRGGL